MNKVDLNKSVLLIVVFGALGAAINNFRLPLFFEAEFVFGPFLILLIAVFRGPVVGLITSMIVSIPLVVAWGSYWPTLIFGLEALFVGYIYSKKRFNVVLLVIVYWLFIGMPVSWYSISEYEFFQDSHRTSILIKQLTNGILYAHITALLMYVPVVRKVLNSESSLRPVSIKEQSSHTISSLLITAGVLFFFFGLNQNIKNANEKFCLEHESTHNNLSFELSHVLSNKINAINEFKFALSAVWTDANKRQSSLLSFNRRHPEFMTMVMSDEKGDLLHSSPADLVVNVIQNNETLNVADRDYYQNTINNQLPYLSPGFYGRGFGTRLIAAVSAAVPDQINPEQNIGMVEGSIALRSLNEIQSIVDAISPDVKAVLLDQNGQILIVSEGVELEPGQLLTLEEVFDNTYDHDLVSVINQDGAKNAEVYYLEQSEFDFGWKLITLLDDSQFANVIEKTLLVFAVSIVLLVLISKLLASTISHSWSYSMHRLNQMIENGDEDNPEIAEFEENQHLPVEVSNLYHEIKNSRLEIIKMNHELQNTVAERTEKLQNANTQLNIMARQDALTHLDNRRVFNECIQTLWQECQQNLLSMSMLIIDIDHFKKVNDTYGHPVGDEVLLKLANELKTVNAPAVECLARLGGEEFCMLLKGELHTNAIALAEKIRLHIEQTTFHISAEKDLNITVSLGIATIDPTKFTPTKLYQLADNALYEAKHAGRNQIKAVELD